MKKAGGGSIGRRELLVRTAPACAMACIGLGRAEGLAAALTGPAFQETHKFDEKLDRTFSTRELAQLSNRGFLQMIRTLRKEMDDGEVVRLLKLNSEEIGRQQGVAHAQAVPDTSFESFVSAFREMASGNSLTAEVVEDKEKVFELRVTECIWATVLREAGLDGDIGHAAVCNMDYSWPPAFNPAFKMERTKTLMQGHDCCNHRYLNTAAG
jgi:hypothetical protein